MKEKDKQKQSKQTHNSEPESSDEPENGTEGEPEYIQMRREGEKWNGPCSVHRSITHEGSGCSQSRRAKGSNGRIGFRA